MSGPGATDSMYAWAEASLDAMVARLMEQFAPPPPMSSIQWSETYRKLSKEESPDHPGDYDLENTPVLRGILACCEPGKYRRVRVQKSAQLGYTAGIVCNVIGRHIHLDPCVQVVMFPRIQSAKDFNDEKFAPMVRATPVLAQRIRLKSRSDGNNSTRKKYPGGLVKFVASNSPSDVKSTTAKIIIVEEPDDTSKDVKGQGNSGALLRERGKTVRNFFDLTGGSPTAKGASEIEKEMSTTDQRRFMAACHHCGERHEPEWAHVTVPGLDLPPEELRAPDIDERFPEREVYGRARWEDAYYACPHCGGIWTDDERCENIRVAARVPPYYGWEPTAESEDPGFYCNELESVFEGSFVPLLAKKYLVALHEFERGEPEKMVAFWNSTRGMTWEYKGELPEEDELAKRAEDYAEWTVPAGGLVPQLTIDVQHDRLAVTCWVIGRGEEMWLSYWGELYGSTIVPHAGAWEDLAQMLDRTVAHASGAPLRIAAVGIDCSDGQTSDAVYAFVRRHSRPGREVVALKGAPDDEGRVEIWTPPRPIDPNNRGTKASRYGVKVHIVGTAKAKDLLLGWAQQGGRVQLAGHGPGRMHWYRGVRADFYEQLLSEMKIPSRSNPRKRKWKQRTDRRNEALDCTVYAVYLSRHQRLHLKRPAQWDVVEMTMRQGVLVPADESPPESPDPAPAEPTPPPAEPERVLETVAAEAPDGRTATAAQAWRTLMAKRRGRHG